MEEISVTVDQIESIKFEIEKAEFNDEPVDQLKENLERLNSQLVDHLISILSELIPSQLPPLQIDNNRLKIEKQYSQTLVDLIESIGVEEEKEENHLLILSGEKSQHYDLLLLLGSWFIHQHIADQATGYFQEILSHRSDDVALYNLSYALAAQKVFPAALDALSKIGHDIDPSLVLLNQAIIYDKLGRYDEARSHFAEAKEASSDPSDILFNWALSAKGFGKYDEAELYLKSLLAIDPTFPNLHFQLGEIAASKGLYGEAIEAFEIAHREDLDDLQILNDLATACLMAKRSYDAIDYYQKYLKREKSPSVLNNLGAAYLKTNQYDKAIEVLKQALEIDPNNKQSLKNIKIAESYRQ